MKKALIILALFPLVGKTQSILSTTIIKSSTISDSGIKWTEGLSWKEINEKAKKENKYIFLDCFATWCGPCKKMDKDVYINSEVGKFINDKFISVKVQMDRTENDNAFIQSWYADATEIKNRYFITGYPSFIFFSPKGVIVHQETGFKETGKFISMAQTVLMPGKTWKDEYPEYKTLIEEYKNGNIKYERLPFMITVAKKLHDSISRSLVKSHESYVSKLLVTQRYTQENITLWSSLNLTGDRKIIQFFYNDSDKIDQVMQKEGYSQAQVDKCINNYIVQPFIKEQLKISNPKALSRSGLAKINNQTGVITSSAPPSSTEADWDKLYQLIKKDFNNSYALRNIQKAKIIWYEKNSNWEPYAKTSFELLKTNQPDYNEFSEISNLNSLCWSVFLYVKDKELINEAVTWMSKMVKNKNVINPKYENVNIPNYHDTYANLLYKSGQIKLAIKWQEKAIRLLPSDSPKYTYYKQTLEQMKKGDFTYGITW